MTLSPIDEEQQALTAQQAGEPSWVVSVRETAKLARYIADTDFVPRAFRGNPAAVTAAMLYGAELGVGRMTALQTMTPIQGKVGISAELMRSLVLSQGHRIELVKLSTDRCTIKGQRDGTDTWQEVTWTLDDAKRADLRGDGWRKYPRAMLMARATTELCRFMFADVLHGIVAVEEYVDTVTSAAPVESIATATDDEPPAPPRRVIQRGSRKTTADSSPGESPPPPSRSPAPAEAAAPDTSVRSAPGESATVANTAGAGSQKIELDGSSDDNDADTVAYPAQQQPLLSDEPSTPGDDEPREWLINKYQRREYHSLMRSVGVEDRDERLFITRTLAARPELDSSSDLTEDEGKAVLAVLRRCKTRQELEAVVAAAHDAQI